MKKIPFFSIVLLLAIDLGNPWIHQLYSTNYVVASLLVVTSLVFAASMLMPLRGLQVLGCGLLVMVLYFQIQDGEGWRWEPDRLLEDTILRWARSYSPVLNYIKIPYYLELFWPIQTLFMWRDRIIEVFDINTFFFAGHPLERVGFPEMPRFSFGLFPLFVWGLRIYPYRIFYWRWMLFIPLVSTMIWGIQTRYSLISFYPFIVLMIWMGARGVYLKWRGENYEH